MRMSLLGSSALRSVAILALATATPAFAQQTGNDNSSVKADDPDTLGQTEVELESGEAANEEQILVTGSRIRSPNLVSPVPITSVSAVELTNRGSVSLGDALNQLPALRSTWSQANSTRAIGTAGLNLLDLRGLGTSRTLVLVNGRRHVTSTPGSYDVDVNNIPMDLLERVDIVTGGNSAVYGSDAIAGAVNFILKRDFEGFKVRGQGGASTFGDRGSYFVSAIAGRNFFDDRLNIAVAAEYSRAEPVYHRQRDFMTGAYTGTPGWVTTQPTSYLNSAGVPVPIPNRNNDGIPNTTFVNGNPGITFGNISLGGYVTGVCGTTAATTPVNASLVCTGGLSPTSGARLAYNFAFLPDGTLARDDQSRGLTDLRPQGGGFLGGLSATGLEGAMLIPGNTRYATNLLMNADISTAFQPFLEATYVRVEANQTSTQPTFFQNRAFLLTNPFLSDQARTTLQQVLPAGATSFGLTRFNIDFGTRAEDHLRETYRVVAGVRGDISANLNYEVFFNYGRAETYYETGGNTATARVNNALNAVRNASGQIVCAINADASTTNDDANCVPINPFGQGSPSAAAVNYVLHTSSREEWAEQINAVGFISGDSSSLFELPGGGVGFVLGAEYRREDAYSDYDDFTQSGATFLNAIAAFDPPAVELIEGFGELRIPLLAERPFFEELTAELSGRVSKATGAKAVWAYNGSVTYSPIADIRLRAGYARAVRTPNLGNLYATRSTTFVNGLVDPCSQTVINDNPNRATNCAAAGIPTTMTLPSGAVVPWVNTPGSGVAGWNQGNQDLEPEISNSFTVGAVFQPSMLPGFSVSVDYYNIKVKDVISGLTGQAIINRCYDDPGGLDNPFCSAVFRRRAAGLEDFTFNGQESRQIPGAPNLVFARVGDGVGFVNQPYNFAALKTSGIDVDAAYRTSLGGEAMLNLRAIVSYLMNRESFSYITQPDRSDRLHGTLGDPIWSASFNANVDLGQFDIGYNARFVGRQTIGAWETQFSWQGRQPTNPDAWPVTHHPDIVYHNVRVGFEPEERFNFYVGVDNVLNQLPPYGLDGTGAGGGVFPNIGRFFYAGAEVSF